MLSQIAVSEKEGLSHEIFLIEATRGSYLEIDEIVFVLENLRAVTRAQYMAA